MKETPEAYAIMGCARRVHATYGFGFLESAYGDALEIEFRKSGIPYVREDAVRIYYDGQPLPTVWRADFTCLERRFIVELKAVKTSVCFGHRRVTDKGPAGRCHWSWLPCAKRRRSGSGAPLTTFGV